MRLRSWLELFAVSEVLRQQEQQLRQQEEQSELLRQGLDMQEAAFAADHPNLYQAAQRQRLEEQRQKFEARRHVERERQTTTLVLTILACAVILPLLVFLAWR